MTLTSVELVALVDFLCATIELNTNTTLMRVVSLHCFIKAPFRGSKAESINAKNSSKTHYFQPKAKRKSSLDIGLQIRDVLDT